MTAKEYLNSISELNNTINTKQSMLDGLEKDVGRLCAVTYDGVRVNSSKQSDPTEIIDKIDRLRREINSDIDRLVDLKTEAKIRISRVYNQRFIDLLTDLYINGETLEGKAEKLDKSYMTICRWHGQALKIFRKENNML